MRLRYRFAGLFVVVAIALLLVSVGPLFAWGGGGGNQNPGDSPGPPNCGQGGSGGAGGSSSGGGCGGGGCGGLGGGHMGQGSHSQGGGFGGPVGGSGEVVLFGIGGKPTASINTYTGNLTIQDMPVYYQAVGDAIPFAVFYNSQTADGTGAKLGAKWSHSYNVSIVSHLPTYITVKEGNGWERDFWKLDSGYESPMGTFYRVEAEGSGWKLTRPNCQTLHFNGAGRLTSVEDKDGLTWTVTFIMGHISTITDPKGRQTTLSYTNNLLTRVTVPGGLHADFTYDTNTPVRLSIITDAAGQTFTFTYSGTDTKVASIVEPGGRELEYWYGTFNGKAVVDHADIYGLASSTMYYDYTPQANGQLYVDITETKDGGNRVTRHVYENTDDPPNGRYFGVLLQVVEDCGDASHLNLTQTWSYDWDLRKVRYRDSYQPETGGKPHRHFYYYEDASNPVRMTRYVDPENSDAGETGTPSENCPSYHYQYDSLGNLTEITTPENRVTDFTYASGTNRLSQMIIRDQDLSGNPVDRITSYAYWDATYGYQLKTVTDARNNTTNLAYDSATGYLTTVTPPIGGATTFGSNDVGDVSSVTDGNSNTTSYQYDGIHRVTQVTYPDVGAGQKTKTFTWTCCGLDQATDENGIVTKNEYDAYTKWLWKTHEDYNGLNYMTRYGYDEAGNLKTVTNARGKVTTYWYDGADRRYHADYPDSTHESWTYRDDGRLATHTDARGRQTSYRYDADDRLWGPAGSGYVAVNYPNDTDVNLSRDKDGLVTSLADASGTTSIVYYPSQWVERVTNGASKTVTYQYNGVGDVATLTTPGGLNFTYGYNARNQIASVANPNGVTVSFTYDNGGRRTRVTRPGSYIQYDYNARDWTTAVLNRNTGGVGVMCDARYYYQDGALWDHAGNPLKKVENWGGLDYPTTYRYDHVYRLTEDTRRDGQGLINWQYLFGYDAVGNRTSRNRGGTTVTYSYDDNDKLISASDGSSFGYDLNGSMTSVSGPLGSWSLVYDDENRPTSITYPTGTDSFLWNALGQRMRATLNGTVKRYIYDGDRVLEQTDDAGNVAARYTTESSSYYQPLMHLWIASGGLSRYPLYDAQGTVRRLADDSGAKTDFYTHSAFGYEYPPTGSTPNPYRFGGAWGYITDPSGMLQLGARFYWPEIGRFMQQDPAKKGIDLYLYGENRPLRRIDPTGLETRQQCLAWCYEDYRDDTVACTDQGLVCVVAAQFGWAGGPLCAAGGSLLCLLSYDRCMAKADKDYEKCKSRCPPK
jgi:RHS repeat-associated protein